MYLCVYMYLVSLLILYSSFTVYNMLVVVNTNLCLVVPQVRVMERRLEWSAGGVGGGGDGGGGDRVEDVEDMDDLQVEMEEKEAVITTLSTQVEEQVGGGGSDLTARGREGVEVMVGRMVRGCGWGGRKGLYVGID